jgi:ankyrin repeat protein
MTEKDDFLAAIAAGDRTRVKAFLEEKPSLAAEKNASGVTAPLLALYHHKPEIAKLLVDRKRALAPLDVFEAAAFGDTARLEAILDEDPTRVDAFSQDGFFPLGLSAFFGHEAAVAVLLERGANPRLGARNPMKVAAIHAAAAAKSVSISRRLLDAGADVNAVQQGKFTPLHAAAMEGQLELAKLLLDRGADPQARTEDGRTALALAQGAGHAELVELLSGRP